MGLGDELKLMKIRRLEQRRDCDGLGALLDERQLAWDPRA